MVQTMNIEFKLQNETFSKMKIGLAQHVKVPVTNPGDLSSMAGTLMIEGETLCNSCKLPSGLHVCSVVCVFSINK